MLNEQTIHVLKNKRDLINNISNCFCSAKWLQTTLYLQNGYNHSCHHPEPHKVPLSELEESPLALFNSKHKKEQRAKMIAGVRPEECSYCWKIEDLNQNHFSDRHYKTADWWAWDRLDEVASIDPDDNVIPSYLEVSFSNSCNFKCVYCSPEISSKWVEEIQENGPYPLTQGDRNLDYLKTIGKFPYKHSDDNPYVTAFWSQFSKVLPQLKVFRITGGEPLMSKDMWKVLEYIKNNPQLQLELAINTNLCVPDNLISRLISCINEIKDKVKKVEIYTSLESTGSQAEYARYGLNYNQWLTNIRSVLTHTNCNVSIMTTINILSLPSFTDFINTVMQLRTEYNHDFSYNRIPLSINILYWPEYLSIMMLPLDIREEYANKILALGESWLKYNSKEKYARLYLEEWNNLQRFCNLMKEGDTAEHNRANFVRFIKTADHRRGTHFVNVFPEYATLLEDWDA